MYQCFADWNDVGNIEIASNYFELNKIKPSIICGIIQNVMILNCKFILHINNKVSLDTAELQERENSVIITIKIMWCKWWKLMVMIFKIIIVVYITYVMCIDKLLHSWKITGTLIENYENLKANNSLLWIHNVQPTPTGCTDWWCANP